MFLLGFFLGFERFSRVFLNFSTVFVGFWWFLGFLLVLFSSVFSLWFC